MLSFPTNNEYEATSNSVRKAIAYMNAKHLVSITEFRKSDSKKSKNRGKRVKLNTVDKNCSHKYISLTCFVTINKSLPRIQRYGLCTPGTHGSTEDKSGQ